MLEVVFVIVKVFSAPPVTSGYFLVVRSAQVPVGVGLYCN